MLVLKTDAYLRGRATSVRTLQDGLFSQFGRVQIVQDVSSLYGDADRNEIAKLSEEICEEGVQPAQNSRRGAYIKRVFELDVGFGGAQDQNDQVDHGQDEKEAKSEVLPHHLLPVDDYAGRIAEYAEANDEAEQGAQYEIGVLFECGLVDFHEVERRS